MLPPLVLRFPGGAKISANTRVSGQIAKAAVQAGHELLNRVDESHTPESDLEAGHADLDVLDALMPQIKTQSVALFAAAERLRGKAVEGSGALFELAGNTAAHVSAIKAADDRFDDTSVLAIADELERTSSALVEEANLIRTRRDKLDTVLRQTVAKCLCRDDVDHVALIDQYETPVGMDLEIKRPARDPIRFEPVGEPYRDERGRLMQPHGVVSAPEKFDRGKAIRSKALQYRAKTKSAREAKELAGAARTKARLLKRAAAIWENSK